MARTDPLTAFSPLTASWFAGAFAAPTPVQLQAWDVIRTGQHALVVAPTGAGKTLAAFLAALDRLVTSPVPSDPKRRCRVLYVSPMKALAVDVQRNLRAPLAGLTGAATRLGLPMPDVSVGIRTGDTPADDRRRMARTPPDILITTPESLFLVLTSSAREALLGVESVILDEVHAIAGNKRGAHLAVSLERLDVLLERPAQRIGLSATVRPVAEVARFLGGGRPVTIVAPPSEKSVEIEIQVPVEDMTALAEQAALAPAEPGQPPPRPSIWPAVERRILDLVTSHSSTLVFTNSRGSAERLCSRLNELAAESAGTELPEPGMPAGIVGPSGIGRAAPIEIARAHHGSVSRTQRTLIEDELKAGRLPAVVATSTLELGIDMGAVDLAVQVEAPPSVASGLQRVGRAGHSVGEVSRGVIFPKHRGDLLAAAVVAERMRAGQIEALHVPRNPLDVLAQQIVAMLAVDEWTVDDLAVLVRRAAPFQDLPASALEATLDMLAGRYPSDDFAELRPRITWDRASNLLRARPGAQRLAVTSGGTIPDRGLFGVFLAGAERAARVGELDEEMVYESRAGDVIVLGASSWRVREITHDRVLVDPAPGLPGRLPFWHGDRPGRPLELGRALGAFVRELGRLGPEEAADRARQAGLDEWAAANLVAYLDEQKQATGRPPDDRTIVIERFRDEIGDWRLCVHSLFGAKVNAPWAMALAARLREELGVEVASMHSDDGIMLRIPDVDEPPSGRLAVLAPDEVEPIVTSEVGTSALFAARFRECAARALLLPRRNPARRTPLWQQRQRSALLLQVASRFTSFPIVLETMRECLQDVFDVPGLRELMAEVAGRKLRFVEVETPAASPFARSLLFGYVAAFLYEGDAPLAERRAQALAVDPTLLAELLGQAELRELLDPDALAEVEAELQRRAPDRSARDLEDAADLLRVLGDLTIDEAVVRGVEPAWLSALQRTGRAVTVRVAGEARWIAAEDVARFRDALGAMPPPGVPQAYLEPVADPLGDLVSRYARTHGPFTAAEVAHRFGLGVAPVIGTLDKLAAAGKVVHGAFRPGGSGTEWCTPDVLRRLRRRTLARLRHDVEPVPAQTLGRFLPAWQAVGTGGSGPDAVLRAVEQLQGARVPASALEHLILPSRVGDYTPALLDELCASGEVQWAGAGALPGEDGWVVLTLAENASLLLPPPDPEAVAFPPHQAVLEELATGHALFFRALSDRLTLLDDTALTQVLWDLVWSGHLTNDTLAPLRALLGSRPTRTRPRPARGRYGRPVLPRRPGPPAAAGRWSLLPDRDLDPTRRAHVRAATLLDRHGIITRGAAAAEEAPGGFAGLYPVLRAFEDSGQCRRGYFIESLGAAQFAATGAPERLRSLGPDSRPAAAESPWTPDERDEVRALVLAATDPANPYGAALPWPSRPGAAGAAGAAGPAGPDGGHRPGRKAGSLVVLVDGALVLYVERGGRTLLSWSADPAALQPAADALALAVRDGWLGRLAVQRADGHEVTGLPLDAPLVAALEAAGFRPTPRGLRLRA